MSIVVLQRPTFVSFDILDDQRRAQARRLLRRRGDWVQRSLWVALPSRAADVDRVVDELSEHLTAVDRLIVHRPCLPCLSMVALRPGWRQDLDAARQAPSCVEPFQTDVPRLDTRGAAAAMVRPFAAGRGGR